MPKSSSSSSSPEKPTTSTTFDRQFDSEEETNDDETELQLLTRPSYYVTRWAIFRCLAAVYWVAFVSAWNQNPGLIGSQGLEPAKEAFGLQAEKYSGTPWQGFLQQPSLFWFVPLTDETLDGVAIAGILISTLIVTGYYVSWLSWLSLWLLQFTLVTTAQHTAFYQYGWESQLLETGMLAVFLCELPRIENWRLNMALQPTFQTPPSPLILWLLKWLCFRISMGAGLIKRRGHSCWTHKTCLWYHFETQPIPSPLSFVFHFLPQSILSHAVDLDMVVQFYTSPLILLVGNGKFVRTIVRTAGMVQAGFMVNIMISGNFSFLNHLTIVPALAALDDACYPAWLQEWLVPPQYAESAEYAERFLDRRSFPPRWLVDGGWAALIAYLSTPVVSNLLQWDNTGRQVMNASFDNFRLVNTYGAFGDVGHRRYEPIVSISQDDGQTWTELEFPCKPGSVSRRPCFCAPYHYRVDWNIWFLGFEPHDAMLKRREKWLYALLQKLLQTDRSGPWLDLLDPSSKQFLQQQPHAIQYAKVDMYHYQMAAPLWEILPQYWKSGDQAVQWWNRSYKESLIDPIGWNSQDGLFYANLN